MDTGELNILHGHDADVLSFAAAENYIATEERALLHRIKAAEELHVANGFLRLGAGQRVIIIEDHAVAGPLVEEDVLLGGHILLHIGMDIQMVGGEVGNHRHMGAVGHGHQLKTGQFQHRKVGDTHGVSLAQQGIADIAAEMDSIARLLQQFGNDGGSRSLAIRAGDGDDGTGTDLEEHLHLGGEDSTPLHSGL